MTVPPVPSVQPVTTRAGALVVRVEHWTPKGDYTERGDKERYRNESDQIKKLPKKSSPKNWNHLQFHIINAFKNESGQKKVHQKILIAFKFKWKILYKLIGPRKKIIKEFPLNLISFKFTWKILYKLIGPRKKIIREFP